MLQKYKIFNSHIVSSPQDGIHKRLSEIVLKHSSTQYLKPFQTHNLEIFETLLARIDAQNTKKLILDSCCGTGMSTYHLAKKYPDHLVVAIDRSKVRLNKQDTNMPSNTLFLRGNCEDIWRLCIKNEITFQHHYILYPNPYPKPEHLKRRWHGHPAFPILPLLADRTTVRSNWSIYIQEFAQAWRAITKDEISLTSPKIAEPMTLFERKYIGSGQAVYECNSYKGI